MTMFKNSLKLILAVSVLSLFFMGCETPDDNSIQKARACVDTAGRLDAVDPANAKVMAQGCEQMVANMTSPESGRVGFGAVLIENDLLSKLTQMATQMQNQGSSQQITASMSYVALTTTAANSLVTYATRSQSSGALKLATFIQFASILNTSVGAITDANSAKTDLNNLATTAGTTPNDPTVVATGTAILQAQQEACAGSGSSTSMCQQLTSALNGATTPAAAIIAASAYANAGH
jgi:hypothetical protein